MVLCEYCDQTCAVVTGGQFKRGFAEEENDYCAAEAMEQLKSETKCVLVEQVANLQYEKATTRIKMTASAQRIMRPKVKC